MRSRDKRLVFSPISKRWVIAHIETSLYDNTTKMWVGEDYSTVCEVGKEVAILRLPPAPKAAR